ncbi:MAG: energy-dependent translational throttle protein EttA [Planctomycetota bacterium]
MSEKIIFQLQDLKKFYGQREVLKGITLSFLEGAKIGVIGPNGAGKSTLLRIMSGQDTNFEGVAKPIAGLTVGYLEQEPPLNDDKDVAGNLEEAVQPIRDLITRYEAIGEKFGEVADDPDAMEKLLEEQQKLQDEIDHKDAWELDSRLQQAATALCLPPLDADVKVLSGGERRRVALCQLLMSHPDMLLLDEPTNHLDAETIEWLEQHLKEYTGTVILITHDRYFLDNVVGWMLEVERGHGTPYQGNYSDYLARKENDLNTKRQADSRVAKFLKSEREWLGRTPAARQKQSKARLQRYQELIEKRAEEQLEDSIELRIPPGPRLGDKVISLSGVTKGFDDRTLIRDLTFDLPAGAILGVVGANGMGKTTMLRMILGQEQPDSGTVSIGSTVHLTYLDQSRMILDDEKSVYHNITEGNDLIPFGNTTLDGRAYVARFNFKGEDQQKRLGECSGGMRNRVLLARMLKNAANVILLDEPTNDLDLDTLRVLEEAIANYPGSAIVVSHDRYFLNRVVSHILAFEGDGYVNFHHGTYEDYAEWRKGWRERVGIKPESRAGRYRKLLRS